MLLLPPLGTFSIPGRPTATGATAFAALVPPCPGAAGSGPQLFANSPTRSLGRGVAHVTKVIYTTGGTAHLLSIMRPKNWTYFDAALPKNTTLIPDSGTLHDDPGLYATTYKYAGPQAGTLSYGSLPVNVADNAIAAGDYVAYQLADGSWQLDTIASGTFGSSLTLTTGTPNRTGATIPQGSILFFFGVVTDHDPQDGLLPFQTTIAASAVRDASWADSLCGIASGARPGDPLVFYSPNTTNQGWLEQLTGFYGDRV